METRWTVLVLVVILTAILAVRGVVAIQNGAYGTVGRQMGVGTIVFAFGVALVRHWGQVGRYSLSLDAALLVVNRLGGHMTRERTPQQDMTGSMTTAEQNRFRTASRNNI